MNPRDDVSFDPETIALMQNALDEAWASLPPNRQAGMKQTVMAERILKLVAAGERDPVRLRNCALIETILTQAAS